MSVSLSHLNMVQTLTGPLKNNEIEPVRAGRETGTFVVVRAEK
jgi:hypothetical protein